MHIGREDFATELNWPSNCESQIVPLYLQGVPRNAVTLPYFFPIR